MDLRGFPREKQGCLYELGQLLNLVDLERVTFVIADSTESVFLEESLQSVWRSIGPGSPNLAAEAPLARLVHAEGRSARSIEGLSLTLTERWAEIYAS